MRTFAAIACACLLLLAGGALSREHGGPTCVNVMTASGLQCLEPGAAQQLEARSFAAGKFGTYTPKKKPDAGLYAKVTHYAVVHGVPAQIAHAVVRQESGYQVHARGKAREIGLGQIMCATARGIGFAGSCQQLFDPDVNLDYSMRYLRLALDRGSVGYYNAGIHARVLPHAAKSYAAAVMGRAR